jgi:hypothetical protein
VRLNPELESFLKTLKVKYGVSDVDFAKLLFLLDEWAEELAGEGRFEGYVRGQYAVLKPILKMFEDGMSVKEIVEGVKREVKDIELDHPNLIKDVNPELESGDGDGYS